MGSGELQKVLSIQTLSSGAATGGVCRLQGPLHPAERVSPRFLPSLVSPSVLRCGGWTLEETEMFMEQAALWTP